MTAAVSPRSLPQSSTGRFEVRSVDGRVASRRSVNDGASLPDSHCVSVSELQNVQKFRGRD